MAATGRVQGAPNGSAPLKSAAAPGPASIHLTEVQRTRLVCAMIEVCAERGAANITVTNVVERAGVSRRTFYEVFEDGHACLLAAFEEAMARAWRKVHDDYVAHAVWAERIRASLVALLGFFDEEPSCARLLVVESLSAGPELLARRQQVTATLIAAVEHGQEMTTWATGVSALTAEGIVGAVLAVLHARLSQHRPEPVRSLINPLLGMIVLPYLGAAAARRELERSIPGATEHAGQLSASDRAAPGNPLQDLKMRITYRTMRVLATIAGRPGSSNRAVGDAAGLTDQGQVSKLLTRLEGLGLIENANHGALRGECNAWALTRRGRELHDAVTSGQAIES